MQQSYMTVCTVCTSLYTLEAAALVPNRRMPELSASALLVLVRATSVRIYAATVVGVSTIW